MDRLALVHGTSPDEGRNPSPWIALCAALGLTVGCAAAQPSAQLQEARQAYQTAASGPAAHYAPAKLVNAKKQLAEAERAFDDDPGSEKEQHEAYLAERYARLAEASGELEKAKDEQRKGRERYVELQNKALSGAQQQLAQAKGNLSSTEAELQAEREAREAAEQRASEALNKIDQIATVKRGQDETRITLSGTVLFRSGESDLLTTAQYKLRQVADALKAQADDVRLIIEGHTDAQGSESMNQQLSLQRAQSVKQYLESEGVAPEKLEAVGKGESEPLASNDTPEGRANNRRVEIVIIPGAGSGESRSGASSSSGGQAGSRP